jgi:hypothetical protein
VLIFSPVITDEQHHPHLPPLDTMTSSQREITSDLMDKCSRASRHDIPSAVRSPDHQQGHDLTLGLTQRPGPKSAHLPAATGTEPSLQRPGTPH